MKDSAAPGALEAPDAPISLVRAAALSGLSVNTLRHQAKKARLQVHRLGREQYTTRRLLHQYLTERTGAFKQAAPLPEGYVAPESQPARDASG
jgi:hypothetical protein